MLKWGSFHSARIGWAIEVCKDVSSLIILTFCRSALSIQTTSDDLVSLLKLDLDEYIDFDKC